MVELGGKTHALEVPSPFLFSIEKRAYTVRQADCLSLGCWLGEVNPTLCVWLLKVVHKSHWWRHMNTVNLFTACTNHKEK